MKLKQIAVYYIIIILAALNISCNQTDLWNKISNPGTKIKLSPVSFITLPVTSITIDGNVSDWLSVPVLINAEVGNSIIPGTDIEYIKAAVNSSKQKMFVLMKMANGSLNLNYVYGVVFESTGFSKQAYCRDGWNVYGMDNLTTLPITVNGNASVNADTIEYSFDLAGYALPEFFIIRANVYEKNGAGEADVAVLDSLVTIPANIYTVINNDFSSGTIDPGEFYIYGTTVPSVSGGIIQIPVIQGAGIRSRKFKIPAVIEGRAKLSDSVTSGNYFWILRIPPIYDSNNLANQIGFSAGWNLSFMAAGFAYWNSPTTETGDNIITAYTETDWHIYKLIINYTSQEFYIDGVLVRTTNNLLTSDVWWTFQMESNYAISVEELDWIKIDSIEQGDMSGL